jgi:hypothetical protein
LIRRILALKTLVILTLVLQTISVRVVALALAGAANLVKQAQTFAAGTTR